MSSVLVVDDNQANRALAQNTLEDEGYRVILAANGAEGIAAFERDAPDCVLLDVRMPGIDGIAVCERIRALPGGEDTPVIFLTALRDVDTFDRAIAAGGNDFLTKPVQPAELVVRVQTALKLRRLSVELREHYGLLKQQRDDLLRLQLQKERLTAFLVHDLKNPVNAMDLNAQVLLRDKTLTESARASVTSIRTEARQLTRMIMNLLDLSKADEGKLVPRRERVALGRLATEILAELEPLATLRNVRLESRLDVETILADEDLLRRLMANLIENAIRHAPKGTTVIVRTTKTANGIELRISDGGPGIPVEMREKVFDAFTQVESEGRTPSRGSRGLGLTFCKLAVLAHGGTIWIEDGAPGAVFCVRLPDES